MKNKTKIIFAAIIAVLFLMPITLATITITTDKQTYAPGEQITAEINHTNNGTHTITTKTTHLQLKKMWINAIEQTIDKRKTLMPEQIDSAKYNLTIPKFAPPGKYQIIGYAELENGTITEKATAEIKASESLMWTIIKWVFIILVLLMIIGIIIRIIRHNKEKKKEKQEEESEYEEDTEQKGVMTKKEKTIPTAIVPPVTAEEKIKEQKRKEEMEKAREYLQKPKEKEVLDLQGLKKEKEHVLYKKQEEKQKPAKTKEKELIMPIERKTKEQEQIKIKEQETIDEPPMPGQEELEGMYNDELK